MTISTEKGKNWYRTPEREDSDGVVYGLKRRVGKGFEISVEVELEYKNQVSAGRGTSSSAPRRGIGAALTRSCE